MNKVIIINLNGRAFQLEEHGYGQLKDYLADARERLSADPDRDEIMADLEQALADKCASTLSGTKDVVLDKEVAAILHDMGPVAEPEAAEAGSGAASSAKASQPPKRFYLIKEGSMVGGVCTGLAAYFNADVTVVRLILVALAFLTSGAAAAGYIVAMMIAPTAKTPEEKAAARGESFNSQELIDNARKKYAELANKDHWDRVVEENRPAFSAVGAVLRQLLKVASGAIAAIAVVALVALTAAVVSGSLSLLATGLLFGFGLTPAVEPWILGVVLAGLYITVAVPLLFLAADSYRYARYGTSQSRPWVVALGVAMVMVAISAVLTLVAVTPSIQDNLGRFVQNPPETWCIGVCAP